MSTPLDTCIDEKIEDTNWLHLHNCATSVSDEQLFVPYFYKPDAFVTFTTNEYSVSVCS
jgi:hypothetical protein